MPCPFPLLFIQLAERFGGWPWDVEREPADRVLYYLKVMGVQGEARAALAGLEPDEPFEYEE